MQHPARLFVVKAPCRHRLAGAALRRWNVAGRWPRFAAAALGGALAAFAVFAVLGVLGAAPSHAQSDASGASVRHWPGIAWPKEIAPVAIAGELDVNGLPLQLQAFVSAAPPDEVARWFRRSLGQPLLESRLDRQLVLGRLQGPHYLTVQLEPAGGGTRGLLGVTDLQAASRAQSSHRADAERWRALWPAGSHLVSGVSSRDAGRNSHHTVVVSPHAEALNAEYVKALLAAEGYALEREASMAGGPDRERPIGLADSRVLFFKGAGKDAVATIHRDARGRSVIVLNTVDHPERGR